MQLIDGHLIYSATDLNNDLECRYLTSLNEQVAAGELTRPPKDKTAQLIADKGVEHEAAYLAELCRLHGDQVKTFPAGSLRTIEGLYAAEAQTLAEMERGTPFIYQATFFDGTFQGRTDFLRRVERPCARWAWSYEVIDTKLAVSAKPYFLLQLCNYSEHLERVQGTAPEFGYVRLGSGTEQQFRIEDYIAYYRHRKAVFLAERARRSPEPYPSEVPHCTLCEWSARCEQKRIADDHLSLVARIRRDQIEKLAASGIGTVTALAQSPPAPRPPRLAEPTYQTLRRQANLQHLQQIAIDAGVPEGEQYFFEFIEPDPKHPDHPYGLMLLPEPDEGDVYFDMEGDPLFAPGRSLEYLFGVYLKREGTYRPFWATDLAQERDAAEDFMRFLLERRARYPRMHVYHYAPYEVTALKRLMGYYPAHKDELDDLLRGEVFVDLYNVVRQGLRISQPSYSIKKLEPLYAFTRDTNIVRGDESILQFEAWLASRDPAILEDIERYNEDDCVSTDRLHGWLLARRADLLTRRAGAFGWRPPPEEREAPPANARPELERELLAGLRPPLTLEAFRNADETFRRRWLLGNLVDFHRREAKPIWWELYDRYERIDELQEDDHKAIGGLAICTEVPPFKSKAGDRNFTYTYTFPPQEHNLGDATPHCPRLRRAVGEIVAIDDERGTLLLKVAKDVQPDLVTELIPGGPLRTDSLENALIRVAEAELDGSLGAKWPVVDDLLTARPPRLRGRLPGMPIQPQAVTAGAISELVQALDNSYLFVQGPPGSGKSTKGAAVIAGLIQAGKRIAILSGGHRAIVNLLSKVENEMRRRGAAFRGFYKAKAGDRGPLTAGSMVEMVNDYAPFAQPHEVAAGTAWMFSRPEFVDQYDYLVIDEAGQMSLANAVACAPCARNLILLGDPLQLKQVSQGTHPIGSGGSVLQHLLGGHDTIPEDRGVFLDVTYRLPPATCAFISTMVYEHRLKPDPRTSSHTVRSALLQGSGLRFLPVAHTGNARDSIEEAQAIVAHIRELARGTVCVEGKPERPITQDDILIVAPYNAQRKLLRAELAKAGFEHIQVGTVDKFQGLEAPVVFYSMATSSDDDMPRDMTFLFEENRLNVALSRAQCLSILVCSPELLNVRCSSIEHMRLANLMCSFAAQAGVVGTAIANAA
jgi:uncharacterized protein